MPRNRDLKIPTEVNVDSAALYLKNPSAYPTKWLPSVNNVNTGKPRKVPLASSPGTPPRPPAHLKGNLLRKTVDTSRRSISIKRSHVFLMILIYLSGVIFLLVFKDKTEKIWEERFAGVEETDFLGFGTTNKKVLEEDLRMYFYNRTSQDMEEKIQTSVFLNDKKEVDSEGTIVTKKSTLKKIKKGDLNRTPPIIWSKKIAKFCQSFRSSKFRPLNLCENSTTVLIYGNLENLEFLEISTARKLRKLKFVQKIFFFLIGKEKFEDKRMTFLLAKLEAENFEIQIFPESFRNLGPLFFQPIKTVSVVLLQLNFMKFQEFIPLISHTFRVYKTLNFQRRTILGTLGFGHFWDTLGKHWRTGKNFDPKLSENGENFGDYSLVGGPLLLFETKYLHKILCKFSPEFPGISLRNWECAELAVNFLSANDSGNPPILVSPNFGENEETFETFEDPGSWERRAECMIKISKFWGLMPLKWSVGQLSMISESTKNCEIEGQKIACEDNPSGAIQIVKSKRKGKLVEKRGEKFAFVFLLFSKELLKAAIVASQSLRFTGTNHDIVLLVCELNGENFPQNFTEDPLLLQHFSSIRKIPSSKVPSNSPALNHFSPSSTSSPTLFPPSFPPEKPGIGAFGKIFCWSLTEYKRVLYLDLDILILENLDDLLEESLEGQRSIGAVPDVYLSTSFNTGVLVIEPDLGIFSHLVQTFHEFGGNDDQEFLNKFFNSWFQSSPKNRLHFKYNAIVHFPRPRYKPPNDFEVNKAHNYLGPLAVIHFANPWFKPWRFIEKMNKRCYIWCQAWLRIYFELDNNNWEKLDRKNGGISGGWAGLKNPFIDFNDRWGTFLGNSTSFRESQLYPERRSENQIKQRGFYLSSLNLNESSNYSLETQNDSRRFWLWNKSLLSPPIEFQKPFDHLKAGFGYQNEAFATILTRENESFLLGVWGLSYQDFHKVKQEGSSRPTLLIVLSTIKKEVWMPYQSLFSEILVVDPITIIDADGKEFSLDPDFAVLYCWTHEKFERIVFVHPLSLFYDNCNGILDWEAFGSVPSAFPGDWFNWRTLLIQPHQSIFQDLLSKLNSPIYPVDKVGNFLNAYFNRWYTSSSIHRIPLFYGVDVTLKPFTLLRIRSWKILSFDPEIPPFHNLTGWQGQVRMIPVNRWRNTFCRMRPKLRPKSLSWICGDEI